MYSAPSDEHEDEDEDDLLPPFYILPIASFVTTFKYTQHLVLHKTTSLSSVP